MSSQFLRKQKGKKPVLAICYDFDKTLSPDDMQAQGFIQSVGYEVKSFWEKSNKLAGENEMDQNLAYMYTMLQTAVGRQSVTREVLRAYGAKVTLFPGVEDWFSRIREYGTQRGVIIEHYVISSGLKEMIEGTSISKEFEKIYASSFYFDESGFARWPAQAINYTNKTQFLFRIEKGILDINDQGVNDSFSSDKIRVPFRNIIYIGDSDTDIPCMKLVNSYGGHSIGVYNAQTMDKAKVYKMIQENRIKYFTPADYSENSELDKLIKAIIERTVSNELLESYHIDNKLEQVDNYKTNNEKTLEQIKEKTNGILSLESSLSFANTHTVINSIKHIRDWSDKEIEMLLEIGSRNSQVRYILGDLDVKNFYKRLFESPKCNKETDIAKEINEIINQ
ncbi:haloacid dehalogenase-like hydrolase [Treponema denticola]|uniref:haloacid dehalogenase-like hydrolase n=1 Tax=Treponema denticola TaxID=158 RepID=UPI0021044D44|nr:haloacid dehalogenase-like hydrolase [Treponema denticola]UTY27139.1 haloacid dehalogenase-like hydrolase [Treponema denticola]